MYSRLRLIRPISSPQRSMVHRYMTQLTRQTLDSSAGPHGLAKPVAGVNTNFASNPELFHRSITARLREPGARARNRIRKAGWIPTNLRGCNLIPDLLLQVHPKPMIEDYDGERFCFQTHAKWLLTGPLYELRVEEGALDEYGNMMDLSHVPFERVRVIIQNIQIHHLENVPTGFQLTYAPEDRPLRVRIPIYPINMEKAPGILKGGWLNELRRNIDVKVQPFVKPPLFSTIDVGELGMKQKLTVADVMFEGKGEGCHAIQEDSVVTTMISKI